MIILEFAGSNVKLLKSTGRRQKAVLQYLGKTVVTGMNEELMAQAVSELLKNAGIKAGSVTVSIPRHLVMARNLKLPSVDDAELKDMVSLQTGKLLPYPSSELIWDFKIIEKGADGYSDIFLVMAHRSVVDRFINVLTRADIAPDRIILSAEALYGWYIALGGYSEDPGQASRTTAVIDMDSSFVEVLVLRDRRLEFSRSLPYKDNPEDLHDEIRKTFASYVKEHSKSISSIVFTGMEERVSRLKGLLEGMRGVERQEFIHPLRALADDYKDTLAEYFELSKDASLASILGIIVGPENIAMDLLPPEAKEKIKARNKKLSFLKTGTLAGLLVLLLFGVLSKDVFEKTSQLNLINSRIKEIAPQVKNLKEVSENIDIIKANLDMKGSAIDIIREVYKIVPQEISISVMDFEFAKSVTVRGIANDLNNVFTFCSGLEKSVYFEKCQIKYAQKRTLKEKEVVDFEVNCALSKF